MRSQIVYLIGRCDVEDLFLVEGSGCGCNVEDCSNKQKKGIRKVIFNVSFVSNIIIV